MSHQAGIKASEDLKKFFATSKNGDIRLMKIGIKDEQLVLTNSIKVKGTWESDWDSSILNQLEEKQPSYFLYRLDESNDSGFLWIFISYSPDHSPVRQKMLYAATKATLRTEFGMVHIKDDIFGTIPQDINFAGYKKHIVSAHAPKPLTMAEEELAIMRKTEVREDIGVDTKHQTVQGVAFPLTEAALKALDNFKSNIHNYVQLSIDIEKEVINVEMCEILTIDKIKSHVPKDHPRYHIFAFKHSHEGDELISNVFLYTMPGYNCAIKERMLYSTCKSSLLDNLEKKLQLNIERKLEIDDMNEINADYFYQEVHPLKNIARQKFDKPKGPNHRTTSKTTNGVE